MPTAPPLPSNSPHPGVAWRSGLDQKAQTGALKPGFEPNRGMSQSGPIQGRNRPKPLATRALHHRNPKPKTMGVTYYGYRFYDPNTGRWPSRDPIGELGHETAKAHLGDNFFDEDLYDEEGSDSDNGYAFVLNSPTYGIDVNGEWAWLRPLARPVVAGAVGLVARIAARRAANKAARLAAQQAAHLARRRARQILECEGIHKAYDIAKDQAAGCKPCLTCPEYVKLLTARAAEVGGRALYLKKRCDYKLPGSINSAIRSTGKEANHRIELANKVKAFGNCAAHAIKENCANLPQLPPI